MECDVGKKFAEIVTDALSQVKDTAGQTYLNWEMIKIWVGLEEDRPRRIHLYVSSNGRMNPNCPTLMIYRLSRPSQFPEAQGTE